MKNSPANRAEMPPIDVTDAGVPLLRPTAVPGIHTRELPDYVPDFTGRKARLYIGFADTVKDEL